MPAPTHTDLVAAEVSPAQLATSADVSTTIDSALAAYRSAVRSEGLAKFAQLRSGLYFWRLHMQFNVAGHKFEDWLAAAEEVGKLSRATVYRHKAAAKSIVLELGRHQAFLQTTQPVEIDWDDNPTHNFKSLLPVIDMEVLEAVDAGSQFQAAWSQITAGEETPAIALAPAKARPRPATLTSTEELRLAHKASLLQYLEGFAYALQDEEMTDLLQKEDWVEIRECFNALADTIKGLLR